jgi:hypothetical protein
MALSNTFPALVFLYMAILAPALGQTASVEPAPSPSKPPSLDIYRAFFRQIAELKDPSTPIRLNGQLSTLKYRSLQQSIGLTDSEAHILRAAAVDCEAAIRSFESRSAAVVLEARLEAIASEQPTENRAERVKELDRSRDQIVSRHIEELRRAFGELRFRAVERYVSSRQPAAGFFVLLPQ